MHHAISRRLFTRLVPALPFAVAGIGTAAASKPFPQQHTYGRRLTVEEEELASRYLARHEAFMAPLRVLTLPNSLPPFFVTHAVPMRTEEERLDG